MMGKILRELDKTFHINDSIKNCDWDKFCTFSDTIVYSMDFIKSNEEAYKLYYRIKAREIYKLVKEYVLYDDQDDPDLSEYLDKDKYLINKSTIRYYCDERPILVDADNNIVYDDFFKIGNDIQLIKIYEI